MSRLGTFWLKVSSTLLSHDAEDTEEPPKAGRVLVPTEIDETGRWVRSEWVDPDATNHYDARNWRDLGASKWDN